MKTKYLMLCVPLLLAACKDKPPSQVVGPVASPILEGGVQPRALHCDLEMASAKLLRGRGHAVMSIGDQTRVVDLRSGFVGPPSKGYQRPGPEWVTFSAPGDELWTVAALSLRTWQSVSMPSGSRILKITHTGPDSFWGMIMHVEETEESTFLNRRESKSWRFALYERGELTVHPLPELTQGFAMRTEEVFQNGSLWLQTQDCNLRRLDRDGTTECVRAGEHFPRDIHAMGDQHILYQTQPVGEEIQHHILNTSTGEDVEFDGCVQPKGAHFVTSPPALSLTCADGSAVWTPEGTKKWDGKSESVYYVNEVQRFLPLGGGRFHDAQSGKLIESGYPLERASREGYLFDGVAVDITADVVKTSELALPECDGRLPAGWRELDSLGPWALVQCTRGGSLEYKREARERRPTFSSCTSPEQVPRRVVSTYLLDLRDGRTHKLTAGKPVGLTDAGLVAVLGSANDLADTTDGAQLVIQPYPTQQR